MPCLLVMKEALPMGLRNQEGALGSWGLWRGRVLSQGWRTFRNAADG